MTHLAVMICCIAIYLHDAGLKIWAGPGNGPSAIGTLVSLGAVWAAGALAIHRYGRNLDKRGTYRAVLRAEQAAAAVRIASSALLVGAVLAWGWLDAVRSVTGNLVAIDEIVTLAPLVSIMALTWWSLYPIERRIREAALLRHLDEGQPIYRIVGRGAYIFGCIRHQLMLTLLPLVLVMGWVEFVEQGANQGPAWMQSALAGTTSRTCITLAGVGGLFLVAPLGLRIVWDTVPLGPGPMRDCIESVCRRHGVKVRNMLVWRTHGIMTNAAVMGVLPSIRYVLLTDTLLDQLTLREVEAVAAHEVGHVKHRHILWLAGAMLGLLTSTSVVASIIVHVAFGPDAIEAWPGAASALVAVGTGLWLFGYVSRRCEWQADAFAAQHLSGLATSAAIAPTGPVTITGEAVESMVSALDRVAHLNGVPVDRKCWRHGSIRERQRRLATLVGRRVEDVPIDRVMGRLKWLTLLLGGAAAGIIAMAG